MSTSFDRFMTEEPDWDAGEEPAERLARLRATATSAEPAFKETCPKCRGTGKFRGYTGRVLGECHACKGRGHREFRTSPEQRERARGRAADRKLAGAREWAAQYPEDHAWIVHKAPTFGFAASMLEALARWGSLTEKQHETVARLRRADDERVERSRRRDAEAVEVDVTRVQAAFDRALGNGLREPTLRLGETRLKWERGVIYVRRADRYIGKIVDGRFLAVRACTPEDIEELRRVCADPEAAAVAHGRLTGSCSACGRELTNKLSVELGIGPICRGRYFA